MMMMTKSLSKSFTEHDSVPGLLCGVFGVSVLSLSFLGTACAKFTPSGPYRMCSQLHEHDVCDRFQSYAVHIKCCCATEVQCAAKLSGCA